MFCGNFITGSLTNCRPYQTHSRKLSGSFWRKWPNIFMKCNACTEYRSGCSKLSVSHHSALRRWKNLLWTFGRLSSCAGVLKISKLLCKFCLSISIGCHGPGCTVYPVPCFHSFSLLLSVIRRRQARALGPALLVPELCLLSSRLFLSFLIFSLFPFQCLLLFPAFKVIFFTPSALCFHWVLFVI